MKQNFSQFIEDIVKSLKDDSYISSSDIPNIDLYMDQVTTFMDKHLEVFKRDEDDKTLTKTMINNYSKFQLLPPTTRKKYTKEHMLLLLIIFYLKPTLSITDIQALLTPLQKLTMKEDSDISLGLYYDTLVKNQIAHFDDLSDEIMNTVNISKGLFNIEDKDESEAEILSIISTIYMLSLQASIQKHIAAQLIDKYLKPLEENKKEDKKEKNVKKK